MQNYLTNLITEKGRSLEDTIELDGHIGFTYRMLIDAIDQLPNRHEAIRTMLTEIDFMNGDIFDFLHYLARKVAAQATI